MNPRSLPLAVLPLAAAFALSGLRADMLWIEGEAATESAVARHPWWYDQVKTDQLSGGAWLSHFSQEKPGRAAYDFTVQAGGRHDLWLRANPVQSHLFWSLDGGERRKVDFASDLRQQANLAADNKPDLRFIGWVRVGDLELAPGKHRLAFQFDGGPSNHGAIDCLVLSDRPFQPQGLRKPGVDATAPAGPGDWFAPEFGEDAFSPESRIDLSATLPRPAGRDGWVARKGKDLVLEKTGQPVKFWGCGANLDQERFTPERRAMRIRYLAKYGVNIVRQHTLWDEVATMGRIDAKKLAEYDRWFADLKAAGIHTQWSVYYHFPIDPRDGYPAELFAELPEMGGSGLRDAYGLVPVSPKLWEIRNRTLVELLKHRNPHTGLTYAEDPALVAVEMQNEDCLFFWNPLGALAEGKKWPEHSRLLRRAFAEWAFRRLGGAEGARKAWGGFLKHDRPEDRELAIAGPWELDVDGPRGAWAGQKARAGDYLRFLAETQRGLYEANRGVIRGTGYRGLVITTNWLAGNPAGDPANIWTDTAGDVIDRHNYAGGGAGGHNIQEGQVYADSHLGSPGAHLFMIALKQVENHPFSLSEWTMCPPNQWKAEAAPLFAFYGMGLQGWDMSFHFVQESHRLEDGWPGARSYATDTPHYIGQFPALSLAVRQGHLAEGDLVAARRVATNDLFTGEAPIRQEYYDGHRLIVPPGGTPKEVFAIGRVSMDFSGGDSIAKDLTPFWDRPAKTLASTTGELRWDYGRERVEVRAAKTQGLLGRWQGGTAQLPAAEVREIETPFLSLLITACDDRPLQDSRKILITALARDRQTGAQYSEDGTRLLKVGSPPLLLEPVQATLRLQGAPPKSVQALDPMGVPTGKLLPVQSNGSFRIDGTHRAYYYWVDR